MKIILQGWGEQQGCLGGKRKLNLIFHTTQSRSRDKAGAKRGGNTDMFYREREVAAKVIRYKK